MAYPQSLYGDPQLHWEREERIAIKRSHGCAACAYRVGATHWGVSVCGKGLSPLKGKAYCHRWRERDDS